MCLQKFPPSLQILWNLPLDSLLSYLYVLAEIPYPSLQILWNLPLDSLLSYLYVLAEIPPQFADFLKSATGQFAKLPTCTCRNPPQFADFVKSATGQFAKLPTCACRNSPPSLQIFWNLPLDSLLIYLHVLAEIHPQFADFVKSATGQFAKLPTCACRNSPSQFADFVKSATGQIAKLPPCHFQNPLPQFADFVKSSTGQFAKLPICACRNSTPVCRFCEICHWTVC